MSPLRFVLAAPHPFPQDAVRELRARSFIVKWVQATSDALHSEKQYAVDVKLPVARALFQEAAVCRLRGDRGVKILVRARSLSNQAIR